MKSEDPAHPLPVGPSLITRGHRNPDTKLAPQPSLLSLLQHHKTVGSKEEPATEGKVNYGENGL